MSAMGAAREIVLLVDDSPETLAMLTEALEQAGLTVLVARDGTTALGLLERVAPDAVLLDAIMPGIDGFETCRRLKGDTRFADTPVIFMTGLSDSSDVVRGLAAGGVDYVTKPVDCEALVARISVHVANARIISEARTALDVAGRAVLAVDDEGRVQWASPRATALASELLGTAGGEDLSGFGIGRWIGQNRTRPVSEIPPLRIGEAESRGIAFTYLTRTAKGAHLLRVTSTAEASPAKQLSRRFGLTPREGEVLAWLASGKSNRDIAAILSLSPRTVPKHLEQIYTKLGVDNRTSAVAIALKGLED